MTKEEKLIVSAYTRVLMVDVGEFRAWLDENNYVDPLMFLTPESAKDMFDALREQVKDKFMALCARNTTLVEYNAEPMPLYEAPRVEVLTTRDGTIRRLEIDGQELKGFSNVKTEISSPVEYANVIVTYAVPPHNVQRGVEL